MLNLVLAQKIRAYWQKHKILPTYEEMSSMMGWASKASAFKAVSQLIQVGFLAKHGSRIKPGRSFEWADLQARD